MVNACCSQKSSLVTMIVLTTTFFFAEIAVGYATNSMALVADSFHMLSDVVSLFVGFLAIKVCHIFSCLFKCTILYKKLLFKKHAVRRPLNVKNLC